MNLNEAHKILQELTISDWTSGHLPQTARARDLPSGVLSGQKPTFNPITGVLRFRVPSAKDFGMWVDKKNYKPKETVTSTTGRMTSLSGDYVTDITWEDWWDFFINYMENARGGRTPYAPYIDDYDDEEEEEEEVDADQKALIKPNRELIRRSARIPQVTSTGDTEFENDTKMEMIDKLLNEMDVQFHCTCPAFYWQGMQRRLSSPIVNGAIYPHGNLDKNIWARIHDVSFPICKHIHAVVEELDKWSVTKFYRNILLPSRDAMQDYVQRNVL